VTQCKYKEKRDEEEWEKVFTKGEKLERLMVLTQYRIVLFSVTDLSESDREFVNQVLSV
jgi:hypothetical protein